MGVCLLPADGRGGLLLAGLLLVGGAGPSHVRGAEVMLTLARVERDGVRRGVACCCPGCGCMLVAALYSSGLLRLLALLPALLCLRVGLLLCRALRGGGLLLLL